MEPPRRGFLIVHVLKFSRGAAMYLPAGPSGHIVSSNYDLYSEFYMGWVFTIILYILVRLLFYFALSFCAHPPSPQPFGRGFRWGGIPLTT